MRLAAVISVIVIPRTRSFDCVTTIITDVSSVSNDLMKIPPLTFRGGLLPLALKVRALSCIVHRHGFTGGYTGKAGRALRVAPSPSAKGTGRHTHPGAFPAEVDVSSLSVDMP